MHDSLDSDGSTVFAIQGTNDIGTEQTIQRQADALGPVAIQLSGIASLAGGGGVAVPCVHDPADILRFIDIILSG